MTILTSRDFMAGLAVFCFGASTIYLSRDLPIGTLPRMEAGYFPTIVGALIALVGLGIALKALIERDRTPVDIDIRGALPIVAGIAVFGALIERAGFAIAVIALILICRIGRARTWRDWGEAMLTGVALAAFGILVFSYALGLNLPLWPSF